MVGRRSCSFAAVGEEKEEEEEIMEKRRGEAGAWKLHCIWRWAPWREAVEIYHWRKEKKRKEKEKVFSKIP